MVDSLLFIGAGAGEKKTEAVKKTDRLRNTVSRGRFDVCCIYLPMRVRYSRPGGQLRGTICWATGPIHIPVDTTTDTLLLHR